MQRTVRWLTAGALILASLSAPPARADIFRWDNNQLIPGTEGITPGPGVLLDNRDLEFAQLSMRDVTGASFERSNLAYASFDASNLTGVNFREANLTYADLFVTKLTGAVFDNAIITEANLGLATQGGFNEQQFYSTASYRAKDLRGINLGHNDLSGWNLSGQDLSRASFYGSTLANLDLTNAIVIQAGFENTTANGFSPQQLYSTASYTAKNLRSIRLSYNDLSGWNFADQNLSYASLTSGRLERSDFTRANLTGAILHNADISNAIFRQANLTNVMMDDAIVAGADFTGAVLDGAKFLSADLSNANFTDSIVTRTSFGPSLIGFTQAQLYSTASYKNKHLSGVSLWNVDARGWDFSQQNLTRALFVGVDLRGANLSGANLTDSLLGGTLTDANFAGAIVKGASLRNATVRGLSRDQLYSTASYHTKDLSDVSFGECDLSGWDLSGQNLVGAEFDYSTLHNTNFEDAIIRDTSWWRVTSSGFTKQQFYSTESYKTKNLGAIELVHNDLSAWDFSGQDMPNSVLWQSNLLNASFRGANLAYAAFDDYETQATGIDLTFADLRGATGKVPMVGQNTIAPSGSLALNLSTAETLVVRDSIPVRAIKRTLFPIHAVKEFVTSGTLKILFDDDGWSLPISFQPNIPVELGGSLELTFATDVDPSSQIGRTFKLFDWTGVDPMGQFDVMSDYQWDTANLYSTGEVTMIPEPGALALLATAATLIALFATCRSLANVRRSPETGEEVS
jgi:uncharacterized protein YjbI with pentapeptide repeats